MASTQHPCKCVFTEGDKAKNKVKSKPFYMAHKKVSQTKLTEAIKRTIADEIPLLDTYTSELKMFHCLKRSMQSPESNKVSDSIAEFWFYFNFFYAMNNAKKKSVDLDDDVVKRTILDEIPYLYENSTKSPSIDRHQK